MAGYYPPVGFHFKVEFNGFGMETDTYFQSVTGLDVSIEYQGRREAGENRFAHSLPMKVTYTGLTLKRGVFKPGTSGLTDWFNRAVRDFKFEPRDLLISLLNENHEPLMTWNVVHALPKSWKMGEMNADRGEVLIETMELVYDRFTFQ